MGGPTPVQLEQEMPTPLLQVRDLTVARRSPPGVIVDRVSFDLDPGQALGVLGESGSGKTSLARTVLHLLSPECRVIDGSILFRGTDMLRVSERQLDEIRGAQISLIFQEPELALNPIIPVGEQIAEVLRAHSKCHPRRRRAEVGSMLSAVGLSDPDIYSAYSHQLSGGQRQRIVIAQALISRPALLIADEPTSALDNVIQAETLGLLKKLRDRFRLALMFITHNPALLSGLADRVLVMYAGRIIESGFFQQIYWNPRHPYTKALLKSIPPVSYSARIPLPTIAGAAPDSVVIRQGCCFEPRCPERLHFCSTTQPEEVETEHGGRVRCFRYER